jgi:tetratricopeptide (TPR) repeat protein
MLITEVRIDYQLRGANDTMRLVGHVEQSHQSECYKKTDSLTCITCHDPHGHLNAGASQSHYRKICLDCHTPSSCGENESDRQQVNDHCTECHMPKANANHHAHLALTQHRIGIYRNKRDPAASSVVGLSPILDFQEAVPAIKERHFGLACFEASRGNRLSRIEAEQLALQSTRTLIRLHQQSVTDPVAVAALAWLANEQGEVKVSEQLARNVLGSNTKETAARMDAMHLLAQHEFRNNNHKLALKLYRTLSQARRDSLDAYYLGLCEQNAGNTNEAIAALNRSIEINANQTAAHEALAIIHQSLGASAIAESHRRSAKTISEVFVKMKPN